MGELRLQLDSQRRLADWWDSSWPKEGDRQLVREVIRTILDGSWSTRWYWTEDPVDDESTLPLVTIQPRDNLMVVIRFWPADDPPEIELLTIFDETDSLDQG